MKVIALEKGYYGAYRNEGDVFDVKDEDVTDDAWFKPLAESKPTGKAPGKAVKAEPVAPQSDESLA